MRHIQSKKAQKRIAKRFALENIGRRTFSLFTYFTLFILFLIIVHVSSKGFRWIDGQFLTGKLSTQPEQAGIMGAMLGTFWLMVVVVTVSTVVGISTAIYLQLYIKPGRLHALIQTNIANLAGVPSIVYGILGLTVFARLLGLGNIVLAGGLTLSLLILPIIITASQEALRSVPSYLFEGSQALGASKWQTIKNVILPIALPGILTGAILAFSRAIGETAPLVVIGIPALLIPLPTGIFDKFTVLPMQIYYWTLDASLVAEYANLAAATIIVLLFIMLTLNLIAIFIRHKFQIRY